MMMALPLPRSWTLIVSKSMKRFGLMAINQSEFNGLIGSATMVIRFIGPDHAYCDDCGLNRFMVLSDQSIIDYIATHPGAKRAQIHKEVASDTNTTTLWRAFSRLVAEGKLQQTGRGRATGYVVAGSEVITAYLQTPYNQRPPKAYNKDFVDRYVPNETFYLTVEDRDRLTDAGRPTGPALPAGTYARRILERLLVDLSWASSRMEGNTYNILETEQLVRYGQAAVGKDRKEAVMILNHKEAIEFVVDNLDDIGITHQDICNIHALLADGLLIDPAMTGRLRRMPVGISHSSYAPLEDQYEIDEEFSILIEKAAAITDPFEQSFYLLVHIPHLQAFDDINKRTSRIASNIPLLKADLAPMSFVTMEDRRYIDGLIGIYELNNVALLREVYLEAYLASAENYKTLRAEVETPEKAAVAYRDFVREAVRRCVLEFNAFNTLAVMAMAKDANIQEDDLQDVVTYTKAQFDGLHKGNAIRYRLRPEDLDNLERE